MKEPGNERPFTNLKSQAVKRVRELFELKNIGRLTEDQLIRHLASIIAIGNLKGSEDVLMKIKNRREFEAKIKDLVDQEAEFGIILADIDHFKKFNDTYGHSVGDEVLAHVASRMKSKIRGTDIIARYGGEEIAVIGFFASNEELESACERLRSGVEEMRVFVTGHEEIPGVTISIGAGICKSGNYSNFFEKVDRALYDSKENGRNRYTLIKE